MEPATDQEVEELLRSLGPKERQDWESEAEARAYENHFSYLWPAPGGEAA